MQSEGIGVTRISLNFAMFRSAFEQGAQLGAGPVARLWRGLLVFFSRWWQLETLYRSNMKYMPEWVPRYRLLRGRPAGPAGRRRLGDRRGLPGAAVQSRRNEQPHTGHHISAPENLVATGCCTTTAAHPTSAGSRLDLPEDEDAPRLPEQVRVRMAKLKALQDSGIDAYPGRQGAEPHRRRRPSTRPTTTTVTVAGRVLRIRDYGGGAVRRSCATGPAKSNCCSTIRGSTTGSTADFTSAIDLGDLDRGDRHDGLQQVGHPVADGATSWRLIGKCLRPLPDKWKGLTDQEARVRARYVDLAINTEARDLIRARSGVLHAIRETLVGKGFLEVETPILQQIHGGANARPFLTHINAYDLDLYLRIAPELYLKRLCVGGVERVFELGRAFRNEGVDFSHNPEFTLLEAYQAHADYNVWIDGCRELIQNAALAANGAHVFMRPRRRRHPASPSTSPASGRSRPCTARCRRRSASRSTPTPTWPRCASCATRADIPYLTHWDAGAVVLELYERLVEDRTEEPDVLQGLPDVGVAADPAAPQHARGRRALGPGGLGRRAGHRLQRADRSRRAAPAAAGAVAAGRPAAIPRRWNSTRTSCRPWSTRCRRRAGWAWASTAWSC